MQGPPPPGVRGEGAGVTPGVTLEPAGPERAQTWLRSLWAGSGRWRRAGPVYDDSGMGGLIFEDGADPLPHPLPTGFRNPAEKGFQRKVLRRLAVAVQVAPVPSTELGERRPIRPVAVEHLLQPGRAHADFARRAPQAGLFRTGLQRDADAAKVGVGAGALPGGVISGHGQPSADSIASDRSGPKFGLSRQPCNDAERRPSSPHAGKAEPACGDSARRQFVRQRFS